MLAGPLDYSTVVGLWLNLERVRLQRASEVMRGISFAFGRGKLPGELFEAISLTPEEAAEAAFAANAEREKAAAKAKHGFED